MLFDGGQRIIVTGIGMSKRSVCGKAGAERAAALQRAARSGNAPQFFTKRVSDPNMIPMLVAAGVEFGAVKVHLSHLNHVKNMLELINPCHDVNGRFLALKVNL